MKQYRISTENLNYDSDDDAYLAPEDPIHELKIASYLNGLGSEYRLQEYRSQLAKINKNSDIISGSEKRQFERENNIKPGDKDWFQLWFGK